MTYLAVVACDDGGELWSDLQGAYSVWSTSTEALDWCVREMAWWKCQMEGRVFEVESLRPESRGLFSEAGGVIWWEGDDLRCSWRRVDGKYDVRSFCLNGHVLFERLESGELREFYRKDEDEDGSQM